MSNVSETLYGAGWRWFDDDKIVFLDSLEHKVAVFFAAQCKWIAMLNECPQDGQAEPL